MLLLTDEDLRDFDDRATNDDSEPKPFRQCVFEALIIVYVELFYQRTIAFLEEESIKTYAQLMTTRYHLSNKCCRWVP